MANKLSGLWDVADIGRCRSNGSEKHFLDYHNCDIKNCSEEPKWVYYTKDVGSFELCDEHYKQVADIHSKTTTNIFDLNKKHNKKENTPTSMHPSSRGHGRTSTRRNSTTQRAGGMQSPPHNKRDVSGKGDLK